MQASARDVILSSFDASNQGRMHFGQLIGALAGVQVEAYHVDYRSGRTTCYLPEDETLDLSFERPPQAIDQTFSADGVRSAICGAQQGQVMYPQFKQLSQRAGCIGYTVWIVGRHVTYFGRQGETHIERFPD